MSVASNYELSDQDYLVYRRFYPVNSKVAIYPVSVKGDDAFKPNAIGVITAVNRQGVHADVVSINNGIPSLDTKPGGPKGTVRGLKQSVVLREGRDRFELLPDSTDLTSRTFK